MTKSMTLGFVVIAALASAQTRTLKIPPPADVAAAPADATKTASGLASKVIAPGTGTAHPGKTDLVTVHYTGWTTDGKMFDSSVSAGKELDVPARPRHRRMDRRRAAHGGRRKTAALDSRGARLQGTARASERHAGVRRRADRFTESPTKAPADVKNAPADAKRTSSGLAYKVLTPGTGTQHPKSSSMVTVHYSGWTTDGKLFDSSVLQGMPLTFPLNGVIRGGPKACS